MAEDGESKALMKCISGLQNELAQVKAELHLCIANQQILEERYKQSKQFVNNIQVPQGLRVLLPLGKNVFSDISVYVEDYLFASKFPDNPKFFAMHILPAVFTYEELMNSNLTGEEANHKYGDGYVGKRSMKRLDETIINTIIACAESQFLVKISSAELRKEMTYTINNLQTGGASPNALKVWLRAGIDIEKYIRLCHLDKEHEEYIRKLIGYL